MKMLAESTLGSGEQLTVPKIVRQLLDLHAGGQLRPCLFRIAALTATVTAASFGYSLGWVVVLCIPVLIARGHSRRKQTKLLPQLPKSS